MQQWEYCYVEYSIGVTGKGIHLFLNEEKVNIKNDGTNNSLQINHLLNQLGKDG